MASPLPKSTVAPPQSSSEPGDAGCETFVARQPILDRSQNVYAYELLYRSGWNNSYDGLVILLVILTILYDPYKSFRSFSRSSGFSW